MTDPRTFTNKLNKDARTHLREQGISTDEELFAWAAKVPDQVLTDLGVTSEELELIKKADAYLKSASSESKYRPLGYLTDMKKENMDDIQKPDDDEQGVNGNNVKEGGSDDEINSSETLPDDSGSTDTEAAINESSEKKKKVKPDNQSTEEDDSGRE